MKIANSLIGLAIAAIGVYCALFPDHLFREEYRAHDEKVAAIRKLGIVLTIVGLLVFMIVQLI